MNFLIFKLPQNKKYFSSFCGSLCLLQLSVHLHTHLFSPFYGIVHCLIFHLINLKLLSGAMGILRYRR